MLPHSSHAGSSRKKILIFDRSGDQTRLFFGPHFSPRNEVLSKKTLDDYGSPMKPVVEEQLSRDHSSCKGGEVHEEDSEEINALLYSDSDDDDDEEEDEVTSTGHSPFKVEGCSNDYSDHEQFWELTDEVASSDVSSKRRRLCEGQYKKSFTLNSCKDEDVVGSSCVKGTPNKDQEIGSREKKIRISQALRIIRTSILDLNTKDPLLVIDEAINYLRLLKLKVKEMGIEPKGVMNID